jgi:lipopolysaccharide export system permease protein
MRTLSRYALLELIKVFLVAICALTPMVIIGSLVTETLKQGLPPMQVIRLIPYILPFALSVTVPVTLLLATTTVYGRMAGSNEVVAIKALGISPTAILWPTVVLSFLLSLVTVWLCDMAVSWGRQGAHRVIVEAVEEIAYGKLRTQGQYSSRAFSINVKGVEGRKLIRPFLSKKAHGASPEIIVTAEEAELRADRQENVLRIIARNGSVDGGDKLKFFFPDDDYEIVIPLSDASRAQGRSEVPSNIALRKIPAEIVKQQRAIDEYKQELATRAAYEMICGDMDGLTGEDWDTRYLQQENLLARLHRLKTEPHRRWSAGFSCLCFLWVGAPMAIRLRNRELLTSFFLCFLPILGIYYPLMMWGIEGAKNGTLPPHAVWLGNLLLLLWGAYLLRKVIRY